MNWNYVITFTGIDNSSEAPPISIQNKYGPDIRNKAQKIFYTVHNKIQRLTSYCEHCKTNEYKLVFRIRKYNITSFVYIKNTEQQIPKDTFKNLELDFKFSLVDKSNTYDPVKCFCEIHVCSQPCANILWTINKEDFV